MTATVNGHPVTILQDLRVQQPRLLELDQFLSLDMPDYDWLVPNLIERRDRLIVTAKEGGGKSTLLRQIGVQCASGIHPFTGDPITPIRVLLIDLENSARQTFRKIRPLRLAAGDAYSGIFLLHVRSQGLDLLDREDISWLHTTAAEAKPDLIITGPIYRLANGDPIAEEVAKRVSAQLDQIRVEHDCAVVLEAHTPYASSGGKRPERPYGASLWSRWPEFGVFLDADTGQLRHWRGPRDERDWPHVLKRGGKWPWMPETAPRAEVWARIVEETIRAGERPSTRALVEAIGVSKGTISRTIDEHRIDWDGMA